MRIDSAQDLLPMLEKESSVRLIRFFIHNLLMESSSINKLPYYDKSETLLDKQHYINHFKFLYNDGAFKNITAERAKQIYYKSEQEFIYSKELEWLNKNPIFINYVWAEISLSNYSLFGHSFSKNIIDSIKYAISVNERFQSILNIIDYSYSLEKSRKILFLNSVKEVAFQELKKINIPIWLHEINERDTEWLWEYLSKIENTPEYLVVNTGLN
ncbi:hypothetical protein [Providencia huashanensis]|uniref:hypothetical protein n=1 Tax=Providencia huashanensis TaxID=3037798 RepID=UPI003D2ABE2D